MRLWRTYTSAAAMVGGLLVAPPPAAAGPEAEAVQQQPEPNREWALQSNIHSRRGCLHQIQEIDRPYTVNHRVGAGECIIRYYELNVAQYSYVDLVVDTTEVYYPNPDEQASVFQGIMFEVNNQTSGADPEERVIARSFEFINAEGSTRWEQFLNPGVYVVSFRTYPLHRSDTPLLDRPSRTNVWANYQLTITVTQ